MNPAPNASEPQDGAAARPIGSIVRAPKTAELIARQLRRRIVTGELKPGDTIPTEQQLMEQFGVSRPTLREAFRILETESLIHVRRGARGGAKVTSPDMGVVAQYFGVLLQIKGATIEDVYEARMASEPMCARLLAQRRTDDDLAALAEVIQQLRDAVPAGDDGSPEPETYGALTYRFHQLILERAGNTTMALQGAVLAEIAERHLTTVVRRGSSNTDPNRFRKVVRSYQKLYALVEAKDADGAEKHWRTHMEQAATVLYAQMDPQERLVSLYS